MAKIGFLIADGFHDTEMSSPYTAVKEAGHEAVIIGAEKGQQMTAKQGTDTYTADVAAADVSADDFDGVVIPGGSAPEKVRLNERAVQLVKDLDAQGKLVAGICHGQQVMISANILNGRRATSVAGIRDDVKMAGATYEDSEVVVDKNLVTSRTPKDEPAFVREVLNQLSK